MKKQPKNAFTLAGGQSPLLNLDFRKTAFTLAEVLITLSIIGVVAALTIPGVVKHHNEKAWATGQDLFQKKLEVALKSMNSDGRLSGYETTADFVNELKKNIKITKICTDDVTKCFSKNIIWGAYKEHAATIDNNAVTYSNRNRFDWAETVGMRFNNGGTALIAYNKNCFADPNDNQVSINEKCLGLIYDVSGYSKPNAYGDDIMVNANVSKINGKSLCFYTMADGTCFTKILAPDAGYSPLPMRVGNETIYCSTVKDELGIRHCYYGEPTGNTGLDYWAGAVYACGGITRIPTPTTLHKLAQELYNDQNVPATGRYGKYNADGSCSNGGGCSSDFRLITKAKTFLAQSHPYGSDVSNPRFYVWAAVESGTERAYDRGFKSDFTTWYYTLRNDKSRLAVCVED